MRTGKALTCLLITLSIILTAGPVPTARGDNNEANVSAADITPQFGPSVKFDPAGVPFELSDVRGKMVVIIFFQSWCPICNGWSAKMLAQVQEAYGNDRSVILIAMKTDGGGVAGARQYLKDHGADLSKWVVAADDNAAYYMQVTGRNGLWGCAIMDARGRTISRGSAGAYIGDKQFVLASNKQEYLARAGAKPLTGEQPYPPQLDKAVLAGEFGKLSLAQRLAEPMTRGDGELADAAKRLVQAIDQVGQKQVEDAIKTLQDESSPYRYDAYQQLKRLSNEFRGTDFGRKAREAIGPVRSESWFREETAADQAFAKIQAIASRMPDSQAKQLADYYKQLSERYPKTIYGQVAGPLAGAMARIK